MRLIALQMVKLMSHQMKWILKLMKFSLPKQAQTIECAEVPDGYKIAFIPWWVPADELFWKWNPAIEPEQEKEACDGRELSLGGLPCED
jgi:hypothetical protein